MHRDAWMRAEEELQSLLRRLSFDLAGKVAGLPAAAASARAKQRLLDEILALVVDPEPQRSLELSAKLPLLNPFNQGEFLKGKLSPQATWHRLEAAIPALPAPCQRAARLLGAGSGDLPTWKRIERFFAASGFEAVPVRGYVGTTIYARLISQRKAPVCTQWVVRYRRAPYYFVAVDAYHDLGHGLAMAMGDYAALLVEFSKAALRHPRALLGQELIREYIRLFELSYVARADGTVEPIGSGAMGLEVTRLDRRGRMRPAVREARSLPDQARMYRPFESREAWRREAEAQIRALRTGRRPGFC